MFDSSPRCSLGIVQATRSNASPALAKPCCIPALLDGGQKVLVLLASHKYAQHPDDTAACSSSRDSTHSAASGMPSHTQPAGDPCPPRHTAALWHPALVAQACTAAKQALPPRGWTGSRRLQAGARMRGSAPLRRGRPERRLRRRTRSGRARGCTRWRARRCRSSKCRARTPRSRRPSPRPARA